MLDDLAAAVRDLRAAQDAVTQAGQDLAEAKAAVPQARQRLAAAIVEATRAGVRQVEIVRVTGYTRESIRRICRAAGVEPPD